MQPDQATAIFQFLLGSLDREHATTAKVLAAVPDSGAAYTPDPKSMTALDLAFHIAGAELFFMNGVINGQFASGGGRPDTVKTPSDVVAFYNQQFPAVYEKFKQLSGEDLARDIDFHGVMKAPGIAYVQLMISHSVHHRGQLSAYLRPMGAKVPSIYGNSADDEVAKASA
jgi:uncharacterized damage-inducible protein DinB